MSWDYPSGGIESSVSPLGNIPPNNQERVLLEELLYALSGFDSDYLVAAPLYSEVDERKFDIDESNESLFNLNFLSGN